MLAPQFTFQQYTVRRKVLKLFGGAFHVYGPNEELVMYSKMKAFKLKEDIRLFTGEDMQHEVLAIRARNVIDFSASYDVFDASTGEKLGSLRRRGWKSIMRDEWKILNASDQEMGTIREDSMAMAMIRRFLTNLIPQSYHVDLQGAPVAAFHQNFNPFVYKLRLDFSPDTGGLLDRRLGLAAGILLAAIEGKQG